MAKVKCRVCANENDGYCSVKKCLVKTNKARRCDIFVYNISKVRIKQDLPAITRPDWYWNRKKAIQEYKKNLAAGIARKQVAPEGPPKYLETTSLEKPDCLSNFRSTVIKE